MSSIKSVILILGSLLLFIGSFFTLSDNFTTGLFSIIVFGVSTIYFTYKIFYPDNDTLLESKWIVSFDEHLISTIDFKKLKNTIRFSEIKEITIFTNDSGPVDIDLWWRISDGKDKLLFVPGGATGEKQMVERLQKLKDFNNRKLIEAMGSTNNAEFLLWEKSEF